MLSRLLACASALLLAVHTSAADPTFSDMYIFGDSLSDTGNVLKVAKLKITESGTETYNGDAKYPGPKPPFVTGSGTVNDALKNHYNHTLGRFTDGADTAPATNILGVWHEQLAPHMGFTPRTPSTSGGKNYAFGGAETKTGQTTNTGTRGTPFTRVTPTAVLDNVGEQIKNYKTSLGANNAPADALYVIWAGGNDVINTADAQKKGMKTLDDITAAGATAVNNIKGYIQELYDKGARKFLWPNLPPIGSIPEYKADPQALKDRLAATCETFKTDEAAAITALLGANAGLEITQLDILGLFKAVMQNPAGFGYDNIDTPVRGMLDKNPDKWLFWDEVHPTTRTAGLISRAATTALGVPEPSASVLVLAMAAQLMSWRARARNHSR